MTAAASIASLSWTPRSPGGCRGWLPRCRRAPRVWSPAGATLHSREPYLRPRVVRTATPAAVERKGDVLVEVSDDARRSANCGERLCAGVVIKPSTTAHDRASDPLLPLDGASPSPEGAQRWQDFRAHSAHSQEPKAIRGERLRMGRCRRAGLGRIEREPGLRVVSG